MALTHHPHVHGIVPGGGLSLDGERWVNCKPGFFLSVRVLSRLFRRRFLEALSQAQAAGQLQFFGEYAPLSDTAAFADWLAPLRQCEWVVYAKRPFAGPEAVLAYLSRYTHRVAIANSRLLAMDERGITFRWKDYRAKGRTRHKTMTLSSDEFIRRFLLHVLLSGFHRIRHYGMLANGCRRAHLAQLRELLTAVSLQAGSNAEVYEMEVSPLVEEYERKETFPVFLFPKLGAERLLCLRCPEKYGGPGLDKVSECITMEELNRICAGICAGILVHGGLATDPLLRYGSEDLKQRYLPPAARGEKIGAFALTEPDAGSDASGIRTTALKQGDGSCPNG